MKKLIVPAFAFVLIALSAGIIYARGISSLKKNPTLNVSTEVRHLTLNDVKKTNIKIEPDVDYSIHYKVETWTSAEDIRVISKKDTVEITLSAKSNIPGVKAQLPKKFSWGSLRP
jgi:hypothetical protein